MTLRAVMMPAISNRPTMTLPTNTHAPASDRGLTATASRQQSTSACSATTIITFGRALATRFQTKLDRFPNIGAAEITASSHGGTSNVFAATTAAKPPSIRLNAHGNVHSVSCSQRKLRATAGGNPGTASRR